MKNIPLFLLTTLLMACGSIFPKQDSTTDHPADTCKTTAQTEQNVQNEQKGIITIDQVADVWQNQEFEADGDDITSLVKAFNDALPTYSVTEFLRDVQLPEVEQQFISEVNEEKGYASFAEGSDDPSSESMEARIWKRTNGHQLFAISFKQTSSEVKTCTAFYDYNPTSGKLIADKDYLSDFVPSFHNAIVTTLLVNENEDLVIREYFLNWWKRIEHVYPWDGATFGKPHVVMDAMDELENLYKDGFAYSNDNPFAKYALVDLDNDDNPELMLSSNNDENRAVYSILEDEIQFLGGSDFKMSLVFFPNVIGYRGGCGTGCYYSQYTYLEYSRPKYTLTDIQTYDILTDDLTHEYHRNDEEISDEEGQAIQTSFGEAIEEMKIDWKPLM